MSQNNKRLARLELSKQGDLSFLLKKHQKPIYDQIWKVINGDIEANSYVINCARQFGKSLTVVLISIEYCIRNPGMQVRFAIPVAENYKDMYGKSIAFIAESLHPSIKFEHIISEKRLTFGNGSMIKFAGTDAGNAVKLRGGASNLNIVDEAAFMRDLEDIIKDILLPQLHTTKGKTIYVSTPPKQLDHYYVELYNSHLQENLVSEFTIYDKGLTQEEIEAEAKDYGGIDSTQFKREFKCQFIQESELSVIPEWNEKFIQDVPKPEYYQFYHKYIACDPGVNHYTAVIFAYYDFIEAKLIVEDEFVMNGPEMTTDKLAEKMKLHRDLLWGNLPVYRHVADNNNKLLIQDLAKYKLPFFGTDKGALDAMVNKLRVMVNQGKIIVKPNCFQTLGCLKFATWENREKIGKMFAVSKVYQHYDALSSLIYLARNLNITTNPIPINLNYNPLITIMPEKQVQTGWNKKVNIIRHK